MSFCIKRAVESSREATTIDSNSIMNRLEIHIHPGFLSTVFAK